MSRLRRWRLEAHHPLVLSLAADSRLVPTDLADDQVWELVLGVGEATTLQLQTRYGGRAGLVSLVPLWFHAGRSLHQASDYIHPPYVTGMAPGYLRLQATLTHQLALQAEYWALDSHTIGGQFTLSNAHIEPTDVQLSFIPFVGMAGHEQRPIGLSLLGAADALALGKIGDLHPVVQLAGAHVDSTPPTAAKLVTSFAVPGRGKMVLGFACAGLAEVALSLAHTQKRLDDGWAAHHQAALAAAAALPEFELGDADTDAVVAFAVRETLHSLVTPTLSQPPIIAALRQPNYRAHEPGIRDDHTPQLLYPQLLALAAVDPGRAQAVMLHWLERQTDDGALPFSPFAGGRQRLFLAPPLLARMTWGIFQYSEDAAFLQAALPRLGRFLSRWLSPDLDTDGDGLPEWQDEIQALYPFVGGFGGWSSWGAAPDIRTVESPDLLAYLLSEAITLREIAYFLRDEAAVQQHEAQIDKLRVALDSLWDESVGAYRRRDRDTHTRSSREVLLEAAPTEGELFITAGPSAPNRLVVQVAGGVALQPRFKLTLSGLDATGATLQEVIYGDHFQWAGGRGRYTTSAVFGQVDRLLTEGLSRVYTVSLSTPQWSAVDLSALLPLWVPTLPAERIQRLHAHLLDAAQFWRVSGLPMASATEPNYDPTEAEGPGGVWPLWVTILGEALIEHGWLAEAADLLQRLLQTQIAAVRSTKSFHEFYHADQARGLGRPGHVGGLTPLHLLLRVLGIRVVSGHKVRVGGPHVWPSPVTVRLRGVTITRSPDQTTVRFASGHEVRLTGAAWHEVSDVQD